ncbi:MAG: hypothetical protein Q8O94_04240 [bacterium]|nr:hypothetical protein [bacterium]
MMKIEENPLDLKPGEIRLPPPAKLEEPEGIGHEEIASLLQALDLRLLKLRIPKDPMKLLLADRESLDNLVTELISVIWKHI